MNSLIFPVCRNLILKKLHRNYCRFWCAKYFIVFIFLNALHSLFVFFCLCLNAMCFTRSVRKKEICSSLCITYSRYNGRTLYCICQTSTYSWVPIDYRPAAVQALNTRGQCLIINLALVTIRLFYETIPLSILANKWGKATLEPSTILIWFIIHEISECWINF